MNEKQAEIDHGGPYVHSMLRNLALSCEQLKITDTIGLYSALGES